ncbi:MAG TPA: ATP-binding protein [Streptosporangiaceae bacterium]|jgi:signal transduction histidine kinase
MISPGDLATVCEYVGGIAVVVTGAGLIAVRLLAARSVATILTVIAAVTVLATSGGVVMIAMKMFISSADLDVVMAVVIIGGIAGFVVALLVGRRVSRSTRLLLGAVQEVGPSGAYEAPDAVLPAELGGLSDALAAAHHRLAEARDRERALEASRRELVAWVSHDLRTPLAGLRAMAEALEDGVVADPPTVSRYHTQIRKETDRLTLMIDDLFELSRIHAGALRLVKRQVELGELIGEALTSAEPLARAKGVQLRGFAAASPAVVVDTAEVGRALRNLITNAIRHTPAYGSVEVLGDEGAGMARVSVSDSCGGIPAEHLPRVFDVAFRGQPARTPGPDEGAGLGLSIARGIVEAHSGRIGVRNVGPGCQFAIWLPVARDGIPARQLAG